MQTQLSATYTPQGLVHALNIYNFPQDYSSINLQITAIRYLCIHRKKSIYICPNISALVKRCIEMFDTVLGRPAQQGQPLLGRNIPALRELADIVATYSITNRNVLLLRLGEIDNEPVPGRAPPKEKSVYQDGQNVHNSSVNKSVIKATENLYIMYREIISPESITEKVQHINNCLENVRISIVGKFPDKEILINESIQYVRTNVAVFGTSRISLSEAFLSVWLWIQDQKEKTELEKRFVEELKEMHNYCTTGHLARLISVIQGFTEDENLAIRISDREQHRNIIRQYLTKKLAECRDEKIIEGILEKSDIYANFIKEIVAKKLLEWKKEYGENIITVIPEAVNTYTGITVFE